MTARLLVLAERSGGAEALVGAARGIADRLGARVTCFASGLSPDGILASGADEVAVVEGGFSGKPAADVVARWIRDNPPDAVLAPATPWGEELAGRIAWRLATAPVRGCVDLDLHEERRRVVGIVRDRRGGERRVTVLGSPAVLTLVTSAFRAPPPDPGRSGSVERLAGSAAAMPPALRPVKPLLVLGGVLTSEEAEEARALAKKLDASVVGTALAVRRGLAAPSEEIGPVARPGAAAALVVGPERPEEAVARLGRGPRVLVAADLSEAGAFDAAVSGPILESLRALQRALGRG